MKVTVTQPKGFNLKINNPQTYTLKNQVNSIQAITDIPGVVMIDDTSGSTLVYNADNGKYEIKKLDLGDVDLNLDGGEY